VRSYNVSFSHEALEQQDLYFIWFLCPLILYSTDGTNPEYFRACRWKFYRKNAYNEYKHSSFNIIIFSKGQWFSAWQRQSLRLANKTEQWVR
jgi:hypothetical protein